MIERHQDNATADCDKDDYLTDTIRPPAITPTSHELTERVIACEEHEAETGTSAGFRVCDKLRRPLSTLLGSLGYRALLMRALTLARRECPQLESLGVKEDGSLDQIDPVSTVAGSVLTKQLIGLLLSFVGEAITLRLLHDVWPDLGDLNATLGETE
jgi:hypothetical protein